MFLYPKAYANTSDEISMAERELLMSACNIENASGQLYFNYSIQCQVATPKLLAMIQHEQTVQKLKPGTKVYIPKERIIAVLNSMKDKDVEFTTANLCLPINLKGIKQALPKSLRKFDLKAIENLVRDWMRSGGSGGINLALVGVILSVITLIVVVALHFV
jgi:hypothetical protein